MMHEIPIVINTGYNKKYFDYTTHLLWQLSMFGNISVFVLTTREVNIDQPIVQLWKYINKKCRLIYVDEYVSRINMSDVNHEHFGKTTFLKFCIPFMRELEEYDKVLYIDTDVILLKPPHEIFEIDLGDHLLGVCRDRGIKNLDTDKFILSINDRIRHLGIQYKDINHLYYNAGVLLFNMKKIRTTERILRDLDVYFKINTKTPFQLGDQDIFNLVFHDVKEMDFRYNTQYPYSSKEEIQNSVIVHYLTGGSKIIFDRIVENNLKMIGYGK